MADDRRNAVSARATGILLLMFALPTLLLRSLSPVHAQEAALFESRVRPLLLDRCASCHGAKQQAGGLRLDSAQGLAKGGAHGSPVVAGNPEGSLLIMAVQRQGALKMPPSAPLSPSEIAALTRWVRGGAAWPSTAPPAVAAKAPARDWWAFQPVKRKAPPSVRASDWVKSPIDQYILAALQANGLKPAAEADRRTLIRRASFDLIGLPPTPEETEAFLNDRAPGAWDRVIDRLLASPRYGERWGRHWLDVARYADSADARGLGSEGDISEAWRYRDWVIDAFNRDMPYNEFVMNQIAGDLLKTGAAAPGSQPDINVPGTIATGLLAIGNWGNGDADKDKILTDIADDQVDIVSRAFMGVTLGCARCHDHKFDPFTTKDYYGMAGIFFSTHILPRLTPKGAGETPLRVPLETAADRAARAEREARVRTLETEAAALRDKAYRETAHRMLAETAAYVAAAWRYDHRPPSEANLSLADFAAGSRLQPYALRQWQEYLGGAGYRLMSNRFASPEGVAGVSGYNTAPAGTPSVTVNSNAEPKKILTFMLPAKSVCVHPGMTNGVAVGWKSPISGTVEISGRVVDADPACGNGIAWILDHRTSAGPKELARGAFDNGGAQSLAEAGSGVAVRTVRLKAGESIELLVLPKGEYSCDTTEVQLTIKEVGGSRSWNLAKDVVGDLHQGNPHADGYGNPDTWRFYDMADSRRATGSGEPDPLLAAWHASVDDIEPSDGIPAAISAAAKRFADQFAIEDTKSPFWIHRAEDETALAPATRERLRSIDADLAAARKETSPPIPYANAAQEGGVPDSPHAGFHDVRVHIRGRYDRLADLVPRRFPVVLAGEKQPPIVRGSGRLELARWMASETHPLTARVMVNRIWQHHFGQGIVRTPSNFGKMGERPTHPELLDYLASELMRNGWSMKQMHRAIMRSATYRQSSVATPASLRSDPDNRLFGRMNRQRLESEALRDNLLAVAGRLDATMGGPAYREIATPRRTVYLMTIRSDRSGFGPLFDAADPTTTIDHRVNSTVAPQALFMMNNAFVAEQARALAKRLQSLGTTDAERIDKAYRLLYSRPPTKRETEIGLGLLGRNAPAASGETGKPTPHESAWQAYGQVLLCANEFVTVD